ncbi:hypothetical protein K435DRAFT_773506 [Dendrothele bispora CBS 962.96]|uniref:Xylanolytic transcriptional activator regulatory domain-containing protein n=1 Tax=Dendrothele bispora (strain CBS 962.96) TaxID=1314807 RepID=A0A4S8MSA7_DENBC|nr:hypothetical protein K435DRAFT_773506 [Dendrothele bispora CBS 962.96]
MRCEGADNPPCKRCRNTGLECLFEKPSREATLTGEAGLERIRSLEAHVVEIRQGQASILNTLVDIQKQLHGSLQNRSPSTYPPAFHQSPSVHSPSMSTPPTAHTHATEIHPSPTTGGHNLFSHMNQPSSRSSRPPMSNYPSSLSQTSPTDHQPNQVASGSGSNSYPQSYPGNGNYAPQQQGHVLPPFSSIQSMGLGHHGQQQGNVSSVRFNPHEDQKPPKPSSSTSGSKRMAPSSSNVTSANSSDVEDDESGELPASGLVAPWEVLRGLADVASERAAKENGEGEGPSRPPSPDRQSRPSKRRKLRHKTTRVLTFPDVVTKNIIPETEARELFRIFYHGCSTFLPVFDVNNDTFDALHERSPFAVNCVCMVAARVRDGGGKPSEIYIKCLEEAQSISCATLFSPVTRVEAVQAMILVSGWSDNGWLSGGHAVRMGMELSLHKAWPRLLRRMNANRASPTDDRELVVAARTWFCLYLFEHQLSYGTGRPAVLKEDESIRHCRLLLQHPLAVEDDMRLVSTVELIMIRERIHNALSPFDEQVKDSDFEELRRADEFFRRWYATWDQAFSQKYEDAAFYRQSLQIQHIHAELFHNATALRGINGPEDVQNMPQMQRDLAIRSIHIARQGLDITLNSPAYREGMKYAVHYTHATATFAASLLLRLARLFPSECDMYEIRSQVEHLANLMAELPGKRYALTLQVMLKRFKKRKSTSTSRSPRTSRDPQRPMMVEHPSTGSAQTMPFSPSYEGSVSHQQDPSGSQYQSQMYPQHQFHPAEADQIWRGFEMTSSEQLPVWVSDQTLGGNTFSQNGMDAFLLPSDYLPPGPQIW